MPRTKIFAALALVAGLASLAAPPRPARAQDPPPEGGLGAPHKAAPRVLVLTFARGDTGRDDRAAAVQGIAEEILLEYKFPLVDETQLMAAYQLDDLEKFLILTPERARMAELKARFGCELICVVQFTRSFQYEKEMFGTRQRFYKSDVRVKAIVPDTAELIHSSGGETTIEARTSGLDNLVREHVKRLADRVLEKWSHEAFGTIQIQVIATGFDHDEFTRLADATQRFPNVIEITQRAYGGRALGPQKGMYEVKYNGSPEQLRAALTSLADPAVDVVAATPARIEVVPMPKKLSLRFVEPAEGSVVGAEVEAVVECTGPVTEVTIGGAPASPAGAPGRFRARVRPEGSGRGASIGALAKDGRGRTVEARRGVVVDAEPPQVFFASPAPGLTNRKRQQVAVNASDDVAVVEVNVNGQRLERSEADGRWVGAIELPEGASELVATAVDPAGRTAQARVTVTVDSIPPRIDGKIVAIIEGRVDKPGTVVTCEGKPVELQPDGSFRFQVEGVKGSTVTVVAVDPAGNRAEKVYTIGAN